MRKRPSAELGCGQMMLVRKKDIKLFLNVQLLDGRHNALSEVSALKHEGLCELL